MVSTGLITYAFIPVYRYIFDILKKKCIMRYMGDSFLVLRKKSYHIVSLVTLIYTISDDLYFGIFLKQSSWMAFSWWLFNTDHLTSIVLTTDLRKAQSAAGSRQQFIMSCDDHQNVFEIINSQRRFSNRWVSARKTKFHCVSNGVTSFLH